MTVEAAQFYRGDSVVITMSEQEAFDLMALLGRYTCGEHQMPYDIYVALKDIFGRVDEPKIETLKPTISVSLRAFDKIDYCLRVDVAGQEND